jgi:antitoxin component YwqK of YwqJK toxin-antitoxin module
MRNKLTYKNGVLEGPATLFNTDGSVLKEGAFQNNKWVNP